MKHLLTTILLGAAAIGPLAAGTVNVTFTGANGQTDAYGNYISPYYGTVNGVATTIYCDDYADHVNSSNNWTATITSLSSSLNNTSTRFGSESEVLPNSSNGNTTFNGLQLYEMAAYLTTQLTPNNSANGNIQDTIWGIFNPGNTPLPYLNNQLDFSWLYLAEANYSTWASANAQNWYILTPSSNTPSQEFLYSQASPTPEPASLLLSGFGLLAVLFGANRLRKKQTVTA